MSKASDWIKDRRRRAPTWNATDDILHCYAAPHKWYGDEPYLEICSDPHEGSTTLSKVDALSLAQWIIDTFSERPACLCGDDPRKACSSCPPDRASRHRAVAGAKRRHAEG
jgi:hypothetical protein